MPEVTGKVTRINIEGNGQNSGHLQIVTGEEYFWSPCALNRKRNIMRRPNLIAGSLIVLVLGAAPSISAQRGKQTPEQIAAIKKCNDDYKQAVKHANADYKAAVKSANKQIGMARAESLAHARRAKSQALAAATLAKEQCVANAPK